MIIHLIEELNGHFISMSNRVTVTALILLSFALSAISHGENLLIFGDSLSDTGNVFAIAKGLGLGEVPDPKLYFHGRASNSYIWPDYLDLSVNGSIRRWNVTNYAFSGATACPNKDNKPVLAVNQQVSTYLLGQPPPVSPEASIQVPYDAVVVMAGSNDYILPLSGLIEALGQGSGGSLSTTMEELLGSMFTLALPQRVVSCLMKSVRELISGLQAPVKVLVSGIPRLEGGPAFDFLPEALVAPAKAALRLTRIAHNRLLQLEILKLQALMQSKKGMRIDYFELRQPLDELDLDRLGIDVVDRPCIDYKTFAFETVLNVCDDPSRFLFHDALHFTSLVHRELAAAVASALIPSKQP